MADIDIRFRAEQLGKDIENLAEEVDKELQQAVQDTANAAYASIVAKAQQELHTSRLDYLKGLSFDKIGENSYIVTLDGESANHIEAGYGPFDMKPGLLKSDKSVQVGSRAGQKWVKTAKDGSRYAAVPFDHNPFAKAPIGPNLDEAIKSIKVKNSRGRKQKMTSIFKDEFGKPLQGKVAMGKSDAAWLNNVTKFQKIYTNPNTGKETVQSIYLTWRMVSDKSSGWNHPGFKGLHAFEEAERFVEEEIDNILKALL